MNETIPGPAYRIVTRRTVMRCWDPKDAPRLHESLLANAEHFKPFLPWAYDEPKQLQARVDLIRSWRAEFDQGKDMLFGIFTPDAKHILGGAGLHARIGPQALEIGYWIDKDHTNQGLATEASAALTRVAFEVQKVRRLEIHIDPDNTPSTAVPRKLGFTHEATLLKRYPMHDGSLADLMLWSLFLEDYPSTPAAQAQIQAYDCLDRQLL